MTRAFRASHQDRAGCAGYDCSTTAASLWGEPSIASSTFMMLPPVDLRRRRRIAKASFRFLPCTRSTDSGRTTLFDEVVRTYPG